MDSENVKRLSKILKPLPIILASVALLFSCADKRPDGILSAAEMVQVMKGIYVGEEKVNELALPHDSAKQVAVMMNERTFAAAATTDSVFRASIDYYMARPRELERIYTALVDTLHLWEQRAPESHDTP